jgi:hypothetical protein
MKNNKEKQYSIRFTKKQEEEINKICDLRGIKRSEFFTDAIQTKINQSSNLTHNSFVTCIKVPSNRLNFGVDYFDEIYDVEALQTKINYHLDNLTEVIEDFYYSENKSSLIKLEYSEFDLISLENSIETIIDILSEDEK